MTMSENENECTVFKIFNKNYFDLSIDGLAPFSRLDSSFVYMGPVVLDCI